MYKMGYLIEYFNQFKYEITQIQKTNNLKFKKKTHFFKNTENIIMCLEFIQKKIENRHWFKKIVQKYFSGTAIIQNYINLHYIK